MLEIGLRNCVGLQADVSGVDGASLRAARVPQIVRAAARSSGQSGAPAPLLGEVDCARRGAPSLATTIGARSQIPPTLWTPCLIRVLLWRTWKASTRHGTWPSWGGGPRRSARTSASLSGIVCMGKVHGLHAGLQFLPDAHAYRPTSHEADGRAFSIGRPWIAIDVGHDLQRRMRECNVARRVTADGEVARINPSLQLHWQRRFHTRLPRYAGPRLDIC